MSCERRDICNWLWVLFSSHYTKHTLISCFTTGKLLIFMYWSGAYILSKVLCTKDRESLFGKGKAWGGGEQSEGERQTVKISKIRRKHDSNKLFLLSFNKFFFHSPHLFCVFFWASLCPSFLKQPWIMQVGLTTLKKTSRWELVCFFVNSLTRRLDIMGIWRCFPCLLPSACWDRLDTS